MKIKLQKFGVAVTASMALVVANPSVCHGAPNGNGNPHIIFTDSSSAVLEAGATGQLSVVAAGQSLRQPYSIASAPNGELYVSDTGSCAIVGIDPKTGAQEIVSSCGILGMPFGIAVERDGAILVANAEALVRISPGNRKQSLVASGGFFRAPLGVAVGQNGDIFVIDAARKIIRVDRKSGAQQLIAQGGLMRTPQSIAVDGDSIYVTDVATQGGNCGIGRIIRVDLVTGAQTVVAQGGNLVGPVGIVVDDDGQIIVGDPYTINPLSCELFDGGIIRVDPNSGEQTLLARGGGNFVNPRCLTLVPNGGVGADLAVQP